MDFSPSSLYRPVTAKTPHGVIDFRYEELALADRILRDVVTRLKTYPSANGNIVPDNKSNDYLAAYEILAMLPQQHPMRECYEADMDTLKEVAGEVEGRLAHK